MNEHLLDAMDAIFEFSDAMRKGKLSTNDLRDVLKMAVKDGWDMLTIQVVMLSRAIELARPDEVEHDAP